MITQPVTLQAHLRPGFGIMLHASEETGTLIAVEGAFAADFAGNGALVGADVLGLPTRTGLPVITLVAFG